MVYTVNHRWDSTRDRTQSVDGYKMDHFLWHIQLLANIMPHYSLIMLSLLDPALVHPLVVTVSQFWNSRWHSRKATPRGRQTKYKVLPGNILNFVSQDCSRCAPSHPSGSAPLLQRGSKRDEQHPDRQQEPLLLWTDPQRRPRHRTVRSVSNDGPPGCWTRTETGISTTRKPWTSCSTLFTCTRCGPRLQGFTTISLTTLPSTLTSAHA